MPNSNLTKNKKHPKRAEFITGFPPFIPEKPRVLILGSMPSEASLKQGFYYAHQRNRFFLLLQDFLKEELSNVDLRKKALCKSHIALFDVIGACTRQGSLDSAIRDAIPNDIAGLLTKYPSITMVATNGNLAKKLLLKQNLPETVTQRYLPSTSPANALWTFDKLREVYFKVFLYAQKNS